ncbi:hypothetical protein NDX98_24040 [Enterobacter roggenkampii]|uniref:hypothetical protein n=1 Tax=Enterobacteriaceae TaxID=543 RepID=UPI002A7636A4|nr:MULTISPECIES: hypothetical protein [Enterobacteriaceae]MDY2496785.1 hypothetical protein [Salmonella enterica subsp. enterica serovar Agona]
MKTNLAYASNCSDSVYSYIYQALQQRSGAENESLYQQAISSCCTDKQKKETGRVLCRSMAAAIQRVV